MEKYCIFAAANQMVDLAQLVRVPDCGSEGRGFESHLPPRKEEVQLEPLFLLVYGKMCTFAPQNKRHVKNHGP